MYRNLDDWFCGQMEYTWLNKTEKSVEENIGFLSTHQYIYVCRFSRAVLDIKNWCMARVLSFLIRYFSNYCTLHRSDLATRAAPLDPRLILSIKFYYIGYILLYWQISCDLMIELCRKGIHYVNTIKKEIFPMRYGYAMMNFSTPNFIPLVVYIKRKEKWYKVNRPSSKKYQNKHNTP